MAEISSNGAGLQVFNLPTSSSSSTSESETFTVENISGVTTELGTVLSTSSQTNVLEFDDGRDPLAQAAEALEQFIPEPELLSDTRLRIDQDEETGRFVYQSIDVDTGEVRRQFPSEEILDALSAFRAVEGLILDDEA